MGIILYNGDSFTYGDELEGSRNPKGQDYDTHEPHTYAYKLSSKLNKKYVNLAQNGSSNMKIFRRTIDFLQSTNKEIDLLVITWSNWGRFEICEPFHLATDQQIHIPQECNMNQVIVSHRPTSFKWDIGDNTYPERNEILKLYSENVLTMQTQIMHGLMFMKHIQWLCDLMGIRVIQGVIHNHMYVNWLSTIKDPEFDDYRTSTIDTIEYLRDECRIGLGKYESLFSIANRMYTVKPMGHADEDSHTYYANMLYEITKERGWFNVIN